MTDAAKGIKAQIDKAFRKARLERDEPTKTVIGMLKNKVLTELKSGSGATETDELWLETVAAYAKQVRKTIAELEGLGERAEEALAEARFELEFCDQFLPKKLDEAATDALVAKLAADNGITDKKQMGRLMGLIMKNHRDEVDGDLARKAAEKVLS
ncbi:GatB/YqeY domain-containing protein [Pseudenhygromyxa sp. WMMC2535]|uniref:GatB/YqeY domain-containing protein n=1 Tax=Pseudenhygromyxa sp. WMMC2535 TaxID=2712867 RepID=UPI00155702D0|nr:GatB/YqeY domain-containing protein [Pseudenhygromyxa sp. WMMC2535]NVB42421.1 GatB/YqeY domain-containing protein [Pseudenhygromyxa sp. WMMC2535]